jgi:transcription elongation GreA/GreB family factor
MKRVPMTAPGAQRLRAELENLKSVKRPQIINAIAEARAHGDLKENAEYHAAREQQSFTEGRSSNPRCPTRKSSTPPSSMPARASSSARSST